MAKGDDSRMRNQIDVDRSSFQNSWLPVQQTATNGYLNSVPTNLSDYNDIMGRYRSFLGDGSAGSGSYGVSGGGYSPSFMTASHASSGPDPFKSYEGFEEFSKTGGYSKEDIANMRARGVAPVRAAYANAEREMGRQRALQGGYSPNFNAASVKMAREQSQSASDSLQNLNAGLAQMIQQGKLAGLQGMSPIEQARLLASLDVSKFNASADMGASQFNAGASNQAAAQAASLGAQASAETAANQLRALAGMTSLFGTTPAMSQTFGNQAMQGALGAGDFYNNATRNQLGASQLPGRFDSILGSLGQLGNIGSQILSPFGNRGSSGGSSGGSSNPYSSLGSSNPASFGSNPYGAGSSSLWAGGYDPNEYGATYNSFGIPSVSTSWDWYDPYMNSMGYDTYNPGAAPTNPFGAGAGGGWWS
jgi:hypothetical protein